MCLNCNSWESLNTSENNGLTYFVKSLQGQGVKGNQTDFNQEATLIAYIYIYIYPVKCNREGTKSLHI